MLREIKMLLTSWIGAICILESPQIKRIKNYSFYLIIKEITSRRNMLRSTRSEERSSPAYVIPAVQNGDLMKPVIAVGKLICYPDRRQELADGEAFQATS